MDMTSRIPHTVSAFDADLQEVAGLVVDMSTRATAAIECALAVLRVPDHALSAEVAANDRVIDELQERLEKTIVRTIALRAPMADDLRSLVVAIRIGSLLERAGDHAKGIARQPDGAWPTSASGSLQILTRMGEHALAMLRGAISAFVTQDCALAASIREEDAELNALFDELRSGLLDQMRQDPRFAASGTQMLMTGKKIERIGDYAANISDSVHYMVTGQHFADWRDAAVVQVAA